MRYTVKSPIKFNGKRYGVGEAVDLPHAVAVELVYSRHVDMDADAAIAESERVAAEAEAQRLAAAEKAEADRVAREKAEAERRDAEAKRERKGAKK